MEAAATYLSDEESGLGFAFSGWAQAALPHRRQADDHPWQLVSDRVTLVVEPGRKPNGNGGLTYIGVPFGAHARLIMLYLQTEALRTSCREIELGGSLRQWLTRMGVPIGGTAARSVRDQAERISRSRLTFHIGRDGSTSGLVNQSIVDRAIFLDVGEGTSQGRLSLETAKLSEGFFEQLQRHPVPIEEAAIKALANNSAAMDCYLWLAYRLHSLSGPKPVTWKALKVQFGAGFKELYHFKNRWPSALELALAVYPAARVEVSDQGLLLYPSRPPVPPKLIAVRS
ncbi:MAG: replication protein RepA [Acetobacteraceae bacterium]